MKIIKTIQELSDYRLSIKEKVAFVPTMGTLHKGHLSLIDLAKKHANFVAVSIFVNPSQFNNSEDLEKYPRNLAADLKLLKKQKVDLVFCPDANEIYGDTLGTRIEPCSLAELMEGACRPGHFSGVCTIVNILFNLIKPDFAIFGEKDFQQLKIIEQMVSDLKMPVEIIPAEIYREKNGLAASSRNERLREEQKEKAAIINQSLTLAKGLVRDNECAANNIIKQVKNKLSEYPDLEIEYLTINDPKTLQEVTQVNSSHRIFFAGYLGEVRLIDNTPLF